jgi:hypothetical protein
VHIAGTKEALFAMRVAFDTGDATDASYPQEVRDGYVLAPAQWILWSGQMLFKTLLFGPAVWDVEAQRWVSVPRGLKTDTSADGKPKYQSSLDRWRFWRDCFETASRCDARSGECRAVAARAVLLMNALEESMAFPKGWRTGKIINMSPDGTILEDGMADEDNIGNKAGDKDGRKKEMSNPGQEKIASADQDRKEKENRHDNTNGK